MYSYRVVSCTNDKFNHNDRDVHVVDNLSLEESVMLVLKLRLDFMRVVIMDSNDDVVNRPIILAEVERILNIR